MTYLPFARRWKRVRFSIFLCFFLRMRLRRFLISEPMAGVTVAAMARRRVIHGRENLGHGVAGRPPTFADDPLPCEHLGG